MSKASKAAKRRLSRPGGAGATPDATRVPRPAEPALAEAEVALANGQTDTACQILSRARDLRSSARGRELLVAAFTAQAFERWEKPARALAALERAGEVQPSDAGLRQLRGTLLRRSGRLRAALAELDQAVRLAPHDADAAREALLAHLAGGDRGPQLATLATRPGPPASALLAAAEGDLAAAERALAGSPQPLARLTRAIVLLAKGEGHTALPALRQSAKDDALPGLARAYANFYLGIAHIRRRELRPAAEALEDALRLGLSPDLARDHLAWTYNQLVIDAVLDQDLARAADWLTKLSEVGGPAAEAVRDNVAYALRLYGQERARAGDYDDAARVWTKALEITPRDLALRQNLAIALERADRADEAIPHWHQLVQQLAKGAAKSGKERRDRTATADDEALGAHVRAVAHRHLADLYLEEDDLERAIAQMERALAAVPDDAETRRELAGLFIEQGSLRKALSHLERLAADRPDAADVLVDLATAQRLLGNLDGAVQALERAYALAPDDPLVSIGLGSILAQRVTTAPSAASAEEDARRAIALLPRGRVLGLVALGAVQLARGQRKEAIQTFKKCIKQAADKTNAALEVGRAYWKAGERDLAAQAWAEAAKRAKRAPEHFPALAVAWAKVGDFERGKECFKELMKPGRMALAIEAAERVVAAPQGAVFLRRVLAELATWAPTFEARMFLAEGLLRAGDVSSARPLVNSIAREAVETDSELGIIVATDLDYRYRYKLFDRGTAIAVARWLDAHPRPSLPRLLGFGDDDGQV